MRSSLPTSRRCPCRAAVYRPVPLGPNQHHPTQPQPVAPCLQEAEVIFAPYSYLIDPVIRRAMSVGEASPPPWALSLRLAPPWLTAPWQACFCRHRTASLLPSFRRCLLAPGGHLALGHRLHVARWPQLPGPGPCRAAPPSADVGGSMLIFDEAHNIEDVCREAASVELELETMVEVGDFGCWASWAEGT